MIIKYINTDYVHNMNYIETRFAITTKTNDVLE